MIGISVAGSAAAAAGTGWNDAVRDGAAAAAKETTPTMRTEVSDVAAEIVVFC